MKILVLCAVVLAILLTGCGGGLRVTKSDVDDAAAIRTASAIHVKPVAYDFEPDPEWEISDSDWPIKCSQWSSNMNSAVASGQRPIYQLAAGKDAKEGAVVEFKVTAMHVGQYTFFANHPGRINGLLTITDAASGKLLFRGTVDSMGTTEGHDGLSYEGRMKVAHEWVGWDIRWLINRTE